MPPQRRRARRTHLQLKGVDLLRHRPISRINFACAQKLGQCILVVAGRRQLASLCNVLRGRRASHTKQGGAKTQVLRIFGIRFLIVLKRSIKSSRCSAALPAA